MERRFYRGQGAQAIFRIAHLSNAGTPQLADAAGEFRSYPVSGGKRWGQKDCAWKSRMEKQPTLFDFAAGVGLTKHVGVNESIWLKAPPPPEVVAWATQDVGASVQPLTCEAWVELRERAWLRGITVRSYAIDTQAEPRGLVRQYGRGGVLSLYARSRAYRQFVGNMREGGVLPENLAQYFGYGLFVGRRWS